MQTLLKGRLSLALLAAGAMTAVSSTSSLAECRVWGSQGIPGGVAQSRMSVGNGEPCVIRNLTTTYGKNDGRRYPTTDLSVIGQPANGRVSENGSRITYVSKKGYRGSDSFTYRSQTNGPNPRSYQYRVVIDVY
jgi:Bacterial Ig domain